MTDETPEVYAWDTELPGGNENMFVRRPPKSRPLEVAREWDAVSPFDYTLDEYKVEVKKDKEKGTVKITISAVGPDGGKRGVGFQINGDTPFGITAHHMRACWAALFRHEIQKKLNDEGRS